jgi:hypothetical protein
MHESCGKCGGRGGGATSSERERKSRVRDQLSVGGGRLAAPARSDDGTSEKPERACRFAGSCDSDLRPRQPQTAAQGLAGARAASVSASGGNAVELQATKRRPLQKP